MSHGDHRRRAGITKPDTQAVAAEAGVVHFQTPGWQSEKPGVAEAQGLKCAFSTYPLRGLPYRSLCCLICEMGLVRILI